MTKEEAVASRLMLDPVEMHGMSIRCADCPGCRRDLPLLLAEVASKFAKCLCGTVFPLKEANERQG